MTTTVRDETWVKNLLERFDIKFNELLMCGLKVKSRFGDNDGGVRFTSHVSSRNSSIQP